MFRQDINLNKSPNFSASIKDRFESTLSLKCPVVGFKIKKVIEKLTREEIPQNIWQDLFELNNKTGVF